MSGCGLPGERRLSDVALCLAVIESAESFSEPPRARGPRGCVARDTGLGFLSAPMRTGRLVRNHRLPPERHRGRTPMRMPEPGPGRGGRRTARARTSAKLSASESSSWKSSRYWSTTPARRLRRSLVVDRDGGRSRAPVPRPTAIYRLAWPARGQREAGRRGSVCTTRGMAMNSRTHGLFTRRPVSQAATRPTPPASIFHCGAHGLGT